LVGNDCALDIIAVDLRTTQGANQVVDRIASYESRLDLLVNGAGTVSGGGLQAETFDEWERVITSNLFPLFTLTKASLPLLLASRAPSVVNISSVCSLRPCSSLSYSVSKSGTDMFTKVLARELAPFGVRVNTVNPGVVRSNLHVSAGLFTTGEAYEKWLEQVRPAHPLSRTGEVSDVVDAILFLASKEASWITGASLSVDGGRSVA
jgi:NAD(P)-dependent dehydrogenase (short-subunit alcohol dehydrogenase family)